MYVGVTLTSADLPLALAVVRKTFGRKGLLNYYKEIGGEAPLMVHLGGQKSPAAFPKENIEAVPKS